MEDPVYDAFIGAAPELGYRLNEDYNAAAQDGFARLQHTIGNGRRSSAAVAYLRPAMKRGNITLETKALATRILFDGPRAIGIEYIKDGQRHEARAAGENDLILGARSIRRSFYCSPASARPTSCARSASSRASI